MDSLDSPGERLRWARKRAGYESATAAADAHGWKPPTYLGHENGDRNVSVKAAKRYGPAFRVPWAWIVDGGSLPGSRPAKTGPIPTKGEVAAGQWLDIDADVDPRDFEQYPLPAHPKYPREAQYGLIVKGTSINRIAEAGDVLHCLDILMAQEETSEDDLVIVERLRAQGSQKEVTAKRIRKAGRGYSLVPDSTDSKWKPIQLNPKDGHDGDEEVRVIALVLAVYKPLRKATR